MVTEIANASKPPAPTQVKQAAPSQSNLPPDAVLVKVRKPAPKIKQEVRRCLMLFHQPAFARVWVLPVTAHSRSPQTYFIFRFTPCTFALCVEFACFCSFSLTAALLFSLVLQAKVHCPCIVFTFINDYEGRNLPLAEFRVSDITVQARDWAAHVRIRTRIHVFRLCVSLSFSLCLCLSSCEYTVYPAVNFTIRSFLPLFVPFRSFTLNSLSYCS